MAWSREQTLERSPHFFKIFFPWNCAKHLGIPRGFCQHIKPQNPGYVSLTGPSGNVWNVKLVRAADGSMSFQNGWEGFVADHFLGIGDFLVFRYDGDLNFRVVVFDPTSCEKEDTFDVSPCHEVKIQVESQSQGRSAEEGYINKLITTCPEANMDFAPQDMRRRDNNLVMACPAFSKKQNCSIENHLEERPQIVDGSLISNGIDMHCSSYLGVLPQVGPSPMPRNMEAEIVQIPSSLEKHCNSDWTNSSGVDSNQFPPHFSHKKPPISNEHALCKRCFLDHSDHTTCEVSQEPQTVEAKCRPQSGASMLEQNIKNKLGVAVAPLPEILHNASVKRKRLAVKRSIQRKGAISHDSGLVKQHCHEHSGCSANSANIKLDKRLQSHRRPVTEDEKAKALEAALLFRSKHPFCVCVMRDSYVYRGFFMYLPHSFTRHLPKHTMRMKLCDADNKVWVVMYKRYNRGGALSGGWGRFSRAHNLEMDDACIFELVSPDEIQVHIFRVVEEIVPYVWNSRRRKKH